MSTRRCTVTARKVLQTADALGCRNERSRRRRGRRTEVQHGQAVRAVLPRMRTCPRRRGRRRYHW
eukprot:4359417-Pyramimonas_sp.AAC.2